MGWPHKAREFTALANLVVEKKSTQFELLAQNTSKAVELQGAPALTISVELADSFDWDKPALQFDSNTVHKQLDLFQSKCSSHGVVPIYFVTYSILKAGTFNSFLLNLLSKGECDVGIFTQVWETPPDFETKNVYNSFQGNLPRHIEKAKLKTLVDLYTKVFGRPPLSHRAGRSGLGPNTFELLTELGIKADSSIACGANFSVQGGPDFSQYKGNLQCVGNDFKILSLPISGGAFKGAPIHLTPEDEEQIIMRSVFEKNLAAGNKYLMMTLGCGSLFNCVASETSSTQNFESQAEQIFDFLNWAQKERGARYFSTQQLLAEAT